MIAELPWVGFVGRAGSGKDTAFHAIEPFGYKRIGFADKVRECALAIDPIIEVTMFDEPLDYVRLSKVVEWVGWDQAKQIADVRRTLQRLGTEMGRQIIDPELWVNLAIRSTHDHHPAPIAFTDVRFANEARMIRAAGGVIVGIRRSGTSIDDEAAQHESEQTAAWMVCDHYIDNDSTVEALGQRVRAALGLRLAVIEGEAGGEAA
jgi:hypothetical protein